MYIRYFLIALCISASGNLCAQEATPTNEESIFGTDKLQVSRRFFINFDKGNKLRIELGTMGDLSNMNNADSIFLVFMKDMELLKDSLADDQSTKRIDYILSGSNYKKIRLVKSYSKGSAFFINKENLTALKTEQDTINIMIYIPEPTPKPHRYNPNAHFIHYSFFINQFSELNQYLDGRINAAIAELIKDPNKKWINNGPWHGYHLRDHKEITSNQPRGMAGGPGDYLNLWASVSGENYKSYFSPSFSLGAKIVLSHANFKREIGFAWEPHFMFGNNSQGAFKTYRNDFITLTFGQGPVKDNDSRKESYLITIVSFSYLVNRQGPYFDNNTWRFGGGRLSLFEGKTKIEPAVYFNHFFKGVTPSLKWTQSF